MVERRTGPTPQPSLRNGCHRIPDGHVVPQPHPAREPEAVPTSYEWRIFWLSLAVVLLGVLLGQVLR